MQSLRQRTEALFRRADEKLVEAKAANVFVGAEMRDVVERTLGDVFDILDDSEWTGDGELTFNGPAEQSILASWRRRLERPTVKMLTGSTEIDLEAKLILKEFGSFNDSITTAPTVAKENDF